MHGGKTGARWTRSDAGIGGFVTSDLAAALAAGLGLLLDPVSLILAALRFMLAERLLGTGPAKPGTVLVALAVAILGAVSARRLLVARGEVAFLDDLIAPRWLAAMAQQWAFIAYRGLCRRSRARSAAR